MSWQSRRKFLKMAAAGAFAVVASVAGIGFYYDLLGNHSSTYVTSSSSRATNTTSFQGGGSKTTTIINQADYDFFIAPHQDQVNKIVSWLMQPWGGGRSSSSHSYGFDPNYQLVRGGNWPGYTDSSGNTYKNGYHSGMVIIDNNFQHGLSLDWFNAQRGVSTNAYQTCRNYLDSSRFVNPNVNASPSAQTYNGMDRREIFLGKLSPHYGKVNAVYETASQIWYVPGHMLSDPDPIVTALPVNPFAYQQSDMEIFAPQILLEYMQGNISQAQRDFLNVINSWQSGNPGQIGGVYGGNYTSRCLSFTIAVARCCKTSSGTPFWKLPNVQPKIQEIIDTLWSIQQSNGGIPTSYAPAAGETPESCGEALLAFDPNLPSRFA
ncbi:MAG: twin-arginine translocation signal domain-containing protein [Rhabdochlamydiaceae bacterium]